MVKITEIERGSYAERAGISVGDTLLSVNGNEICDVLDYRFYITEKRLTLLLSGNDGEYTVTVEKGEYDDLGLDFATPLMDAKQHCKNGCIFCFIDQNPGGLRESLYFKDDDSRLSFIHGNYVTLTNMTERDVARIIKMRMSPINISIHTTNPDLRVRMMKNRHAGEVLSYLDEFMRAELNMCGQIVLCRGVNDGEELRRTLTDLAGYFPYLGSVSVVPAGLTKHREGLYPLSDFTAEEAGEVIDMIDEVANAQLEKHGSRQFFAADEFYLKAGRELPPTEYYEDYPQIENGVGMLRSFIDEFFFGVRDADELLASRTEGRRVTVVTGAAAYTVISELCAEIERRCPAVSIDVVRVENDFFGRSVTVTGLLTGKDIYEALRTRALGEIVLLPENCLRHGDGLFLCGMTVDELSENLGVECRAVSTDGYCFLEAVLGVD